MDSTAKRGVKRKRFEPPKEDLASKIRGKLHHGVREVKQAARKAKTFETQKVVKKLKGLRKNDANTQEIKELELQLDILKGISHDKVATSALQTKLSKDKILGVNEHVKHAISLELVDVVEATTAGTPEAKVNARLLSSKTLASEVTKVLESLRHLIQPKSGRDPDMDAVVADERPEKSKKLKATESHFDEDDDRDKGDIRTNELSENEVDEAGWESGTVDEGDLNAPMDDSGWESGSVLSGQEEFSGKGGGDESDNQGEEGTDEENSDDGSADHIQRGSVRPTGSPRKPAPPALKTKVSSSTPNSQSTFLPSLAVGFVRGDSESEWSESEAKLADLGTKKNRRGQRARRAIWEKKYGKHANHKKKEALERQQIRPRSSKRGADAGAPKRNSGGPSAGRDMNAHTLPSHHHQSSDLGRARHPSRDRTKEDKPLHPSWEAKRKLKEKEGATILPGQGKKIKFS
ncbi:hypothetical protein AX16_003045 [Volvariella volvacea WC 439]|nr:hypothetical protein AX16_003045 [Volvariella volvacea WC 439]